MPLSSAEGQSPGSPSEDGPAVEMPSDAAISEALVVVQEMAHRQHEEKGRTVGLS
jgi:hypothetical protein